jgi:hypothetical protein
VAENITITGAGNVDNKNFYVDPNGDLYYNVLFENLPTKPGDFTTAGRPLEAKRWPSGETVLNLNGFNFTRSNYNPLSAATPASSNAVGNINIPPTVTTRPTGILPPPSNTAVPGFPENANTYNFTGDAVEAIPPQLASSYNTPAALSSFSTGSTPVSVAMPGSTINANYDSNPALANITVEADAEKPVFAPTRAVEFNPTTGGIEVGPASQVRLASDGTLRITPDTATEVQLGTGVQQAANGDYVVSTGGVAVLPPNTEVIMEPGTSAALMPFTAGNTNAVVLESEDPEFDVFNVPSANSSGAELATTTQTAEEYLGNPENANIDTDGLITDGRLPGTSTNAQPANIDQLALAEDAALPGNGIGTGAGNLQTGIGAEVYAPNKEEPVAPETAAISDPNIARGSDGASPIPKEFLEKIVAKPNPFKGFATMTYSVSLYMLDKPALERIFNQGVKSVAGLPLLIQSGGAAEVGVKGTYGATRDANFHLDFYLDDIEIEGLVSGTSTQSVHNSFLMNFKVREPNGLTFLDSLHKAVKDFHVRKGFPADKINYAAQNYLMVVRFYGYDEYGNLVDGSKVSKTEPTTDRRAVSEKFIPFIFTGITFTMTAEMIEYRCACACPQSFYSQAGTHGALPFNIELQGGTVGSILGIGGEGEGYTDDEFNPRLENGGFDTKNNVTIYTGLANALNVESERAYGKEFANKYIIEVEEGSEIETKKVVVDVSIDKNQSAMPSDKSNPTAPNTDRVDKNQGRKSLPAGTSIIQAIELVVRESEFVTAQRNIDIDKRTGKPVVKQGASKVFQWFKVVTTVTPRSDKINLQTMDYAYNIKYTIKRYGISDVKSPYFPGAYYRGVHKRYPYWFTGENTEIIDFKQDFNYLYYQQFGPERLTNPVEINTIHVTRNFYMPRSNEANLGGVNKSSEASSSAASVLYSPADMAMAELTIVGDPDWIAQSEIFYSPKVSKAKVGNGPFMPDGSVNYDASEVYFSVEYNTPADYQDTGLQNIGYNNPNKGVVDISGATATVVLAYRANEITTMLNNGAFTQMLKGTLLTWRDDKEAERLADGSIALTIDSKNRIPQNTQILDEIDIDLLDQTAEKYGVTVGGDQAAELARQEREFYEEDSDASVINTQPITSSSGDITDVEFEQAFDEQELMLMPDSNGDTAITNSTVPPLTPDATTAPPTPQPTAPADPARDVVVNGTTQPQAEPEFNNPVPPPPPASPDLVRNTAGAQTDGQGNYVYNGVEFSANTQAAYDNYINSINSNRPSIIEDYDPFYGAKVQRRVSVSRSGAVVDKILGAYDINGNLISFADGNSPAQNKALLDYTNDKINQDRNPDPFRDL